MSSVSEEPNKHVALSFVFNKSKGPSTIVRGIFQSILISLKMICFLGIVAFLYL